MIVFSSIYTSNTKATLSLNITELKKVPPFTQKSHFSNAAPKFSLLIRFYVTLWCKFTINVSTPTFDAFTENRTQILVQKKSI